MKGILFKPDMIKAIMKGQKTQTRRLVKLNEGVTMDQIHQMQNPIDSLRFGGWCKKPVYKKGDIVYVKETYCIDEEMIVRYKLDFSAKTTAPGPWVSAMFMAQNKARTFLRILDVYPEPIQDISYQDAIAEGVGQKHSDVFGHRFRNYLELDRPWNNTGWFQGKYRQYGDYVAEEKMPQTSFRTLWEKINGLSVYSRQWSTNPYVWVYKFEKLDGLQEL